MSSAARPSCDADPALRSEFAAPPRVRHRPRGNLGLHATARETAAQADALRVRFHELEIELENGARVGGFTLSAGVAQPSTLSREERDRELIDTLLQNADSALQTAKEAGGDRVRIF